MSFSKEGRLGLARNEAKYSTAKGELLIKHAVVSTISFYKAMF